MNLVYVIMSTLIMVGYLKSVIGNLFMNHNPKFHISNYQDELSKIKELLQSLNLENEDNALEYSKEEKNTHFIPNDTTEKSEIRLPQDESYSRDAIELLLNTYTDTLRRKLKLSEENEKHDEIRKNDKRALTMLSRWKPFRLNNLNGGNGRHVIRSPFTSRSDPNSFNKIQIMGRPFRWG